MGIPIGARIYFPNLRFGLGETWMYNSQGKSQPSFGFPGFPSVGFMLTAAGSRTASGP